MCRCPAAARTLRVDDFRRVNAFGEKADSAIDLAEPPLPVLIVRVLAAIAVTRGPGDQLRHGRAFPGQQKSPLVNEPLQTARRDVVLDPRLRRPGIRFSREPLTHPDQGYPDPRRTMRAPAPRTLRHADR